MAEGEEAKGVKKVAFHYLKSTQFRVVHGDGIVGGVTPGNDLHFSVFSERAAIPQMVVVGLNDDGTLGAEISRVGRKGVVREVEVDVIMDLRAAIGFRDWLVGRIEEMQKNETSAGGET